MAHRALLQVQLGPTRVAEGAVALVVHVEQIIGMHAADSQTVMPLDGGDAAVRVDGGIRLLLRWREGPAVRSRGVDAAPRG